MDTVESHDPVAVVAAIYAAMAAHDLPGMIALCHDDVVIDQDPALPWGGHHVGHDGVTQFAVALMTNIASSVTTEALYLAGDTVVQFGRTAGTTIATGRPFDVHECHLWTIREGKAAAAHFLIDTASMLAALSPG